MSRRFVILGGAGTIGRIVARDLSESRPGDHILIADYNQEAAQFVADTIRNPNIEVRKADARQPELLVGLLRGSDVVINCLQHDYNLAVMAAALEAGTNYVDLGGLFTWTRKQLRLNERFRNAGLTAVIGVGCSPGITNVLAAYAISQMTKVNSIKIRIGSKNFNQPDKELSFPYSAQTIIEELTLKPWVFQDGHFRQVLPRTGWEQTQFDKPVGAAWTVRTRHSEIATLPVSFKKKALRFCDFKVGLDRPFVKEVMKRLRNGWTMPEFQKLVATPPEPNDYEIVRVMADDMTIDCHSRSRPDWRASAGDINTACPISIAAQMIAEGDIEQPGVSPPEIAIHHECFAAGIFILKLQMRGMKIVIN